MNDYVVILVDANEVLEVQAESKADALLEARKKFSGDDQTWFECAKRVTTRETFELASAMIMLGANIHQDLVSFLGEILENAERREKNKEE